MSASPDPQTWVFPPLGAPTVPTDVAAAFGPIAKGDKIDLVWAPASEQPTVNFACANGMSNYAWVNNVANALHRHQSRVPC